ncbi:MULTISPECIES: (2Fe-2S)-binding protein [Actinoalloteichus]|uniref:Ferric iron reductase FhuF-like transporter/FhuF 2Fe-2S C-terminal domain n=1 Tax=Actinoalloteichus fjordicus TaxID=1612552 RepID=A0AAC9PQ01_9PSEU|nr:MULTISPECIES: (2Fe-2S)-binding protein [Actinoalloteichus]APU12412.1 Ferric iron reductase FhuF-like transporter/FhuF 2Fe-2S C-terminal domain [Actinoalloteichus fjordicus]APU18365.1 Ferric iron reductase FhuF-like transporter/FhuF 2Fe-2S C-terminal domain [Actinoalloteichus sp. GBA129-24]
MTTAFRRSAPRGPAIAAGRRSALAESVARLGLPPWLEARHGDASIGEDWSRCSSLLDDPAAFTRWREVLGGWLTENYGAAPERTTAGYVMSWYLSVPGYLGALLFHTARRVPSLRPEDTAFRLAAGRPHLDGIALTGDAFACLPDDPDADDPSATVVADEQALAVLLRARFAGHAARFVAAFAPGTRLGRRMLWAAATDVLDTTLWLSGQMCGDEDRGVADAALVFGTEADPFTALSTMYRVPGADGEDRWTRRRESCCFHYALPGSPQACTTCPRVGAEERARRVRELG